MTKQQSTPKPKTYDADTGYKYPKSTSSNYDSGSRPRFQVSNDQANMIKTKANNPIFKDMNESFNKTIDSWAKDAQNKKKK